MRGTWFVLAALLGCGGSDSEAVGAFEIVGHSDLGARGRANGVEGLALASEQPAVQEFPGFGVLGHGILTSGGLFYHGATASLEIAF